MTLYQNKGCDKCGYTGFRGRQGIFEVLRVSEAIRSAIVAEKGAGDISQIAFTGKVPTAAPPWIPQGDRRHHHPVRSPAGHQSFPGGIMIESAESEQWVTLGRSETMPIAGEMIDRSMSYFQYQARDGQGEMHKGVLEAVSEQDAARKLKSGRLYPVKIKAVKSGRGRRVPEEHIIRFFYDLSDLLSAGLPVDRALALISTNQTHKVFQRVVKDLLEEVQGGSDLSGAVGKYRDIFGDLSDHMVRAGEASGTLGPILKRLAQYMEQRRTFRQSLISSMIYPAILLGTSMLSMVVLLVYVIPKFAQIFHDLNQKVPLLTEILLQTGDPAQRVRLGDSSDDRRRLFWRSQSLQTPRGAQKDGSNSVSGPLHTILHPPQ